MPTSSEASHDSVWHLIESSTRSYPDNLALIDGKITFNYQQLCETVNRLANYFTNQAKLKSGNIAVLYVQRNYQSLLTVLALIKLGVTVAPINRATSVQHLQDKLSLINCDVLIHDQVKSINNLTVKTIELDQAYHSSQHESDSAPMFISDTHNVYLSFTSGSTGKAKVVAITHANLLSIVSAWQQQYQLSPLDKHLQLANMHFDVFFGDLMRAVSTGACLILCPMRVALNSSKLLNLIEQHQITIAEFVPTVLRRLMRYTKTANKKLDSFRLLICGSDTWSIAEYQSFKQQLPSDARLINSYGMTEATIDSCFFETNDISALELESNLPVPIGKPYLNTQVFIVDFQLNPVPVGVEGEILVTGPGVAPGYYYASPNSQSKFLTTTINQVQYHAYVTGDRGVQLADGNILFLGRADHLIKVNGIRVRLNVIESIIRQHPAITECFARIQSLTNRDVIEICYSTENNQEVKTQILLNYLSQHYDHSNIPIRCLQVASCPELANMKLARQADISA